MWVYDEVDRPEAVTAGENPQAAPGTGSMAPGERAVIDRIEGRMAVLLVGEEEREVVIAVDALPAGAREGTWLAYDGQRQQMVVDAEETERRRQRIAAKLELLRRRSRQAPSE